MLESKLASFNAKKAVFSCKYGMQISAKHDIIADTIPSASLLSRSF